MKQKAFAFSAGEFLDEELDFIQENYGNISFMDGDVRLNEGSTHPFEYWVEESAIKFYNFLRSLTKTKVKVVDGNLTEALKEAFIQARPLYYDVAVFFRHGRAIIQGKRLKADKERMTWAEIKLPQEAFYKESEFFINPWQFFP